MCFICVFMYSICFNVNVHSLGYRLFIYSNNIEFRKLFQNTQQCIILCHLGEGSVPVILVIWLLKKLLNLKKSYTTLCRHGKGSVFGQYCLIYSSRCRKCMVCSASANISITISQSYSLTINTLYNG